MRGTSPGDALICPSFDDFVGLGVGTTPGVFFSSLMRTSNALVDIAMDNDSSMLTTALVCLFLSLGRLQLSQTVSDDLDSLRLSDRLSVTVYNRRRTAAPAV